MIPPPPILYTHKVGVIGGGPAGLSAAYHIHKYAEKHGLLVEVKIYEKARVGGRAAGVVKIGGVEYDVEDVGFHTVDRTMTDLVQELRECDLGIWHLDPGLGWESGSFKVYFSLIYITSPLACDHGVNDGKIATTANP